MLLTITILIGLIPASVAYAIAPTIVFTVTPDVTEADPGDTVTYTISLKTSENVSGTQFYLNIPTGMTYVAGSGKIDPNLKETLNNEYDHIGEVSFTEKLKMYIANTGALEGLNNLSGGVTFGTFQCTVDADASGNIEVGLTIDVLDDGDVNPYPESRYTVQTTPVKITAAPKPATGISLNKSTTTIYTGSEEILTATVTPTDTTDTVTWTSGNTAVATVDDTGKVTAVAVGTATITAQAGSQSATCVVTVTNAPCTHTNKSTVSAKDSTCTVKGWDEYKKCDDCGQLFNTSDVEIDEIPFRNLAYHSYTAETKKAEALKTAGNCRDKAVYYYSCAVCGNVEHNDAHTFLGDKDANTHVGGTVTVNASDPDHKNQVDGYTGDTKCLGCGEIIATGTSIPAGAHTPSSTWNSDGTYHWKECTTMGCGVVIDGSKAKHSSTGTNVATCQHKAICDVCGVEYDELAEHNPASSWTSDASGHWHACQTVGCTEKCDFATHTGGTATCTAQAVCSVCDQPYDDYAAHNYTAETKKAEALKTAGNCRDKAVYYYSCAVCGNVEHNDAHTFLGDKDANTHVGGTVTVNASDPDHKNQVDGYTGDTKCLGCGEIIATGTSIPAGAHTPSSTWNSDGTYHWKECTTMGCGVVIDGSKAKHSSTGTNVATCQHKAICDVCGVEYDELAEHNPASSWTSDASGHWHACQTVGCTEKCDFATHTPDHTGHATEEYAIKCTECDYVIEAQLVHTHVFDKEVATEAYKATDATCTAKATYYKSCACGEKGTATFEYGELAEHNWMPATCTAPKTCNTCRATEGDPLGHDYTKKVENNTYLKTAASKCTEYNVYWYACSRCDANAKDDAAATDKYYTSTTAGNHSFTEKIEDAAHYVAGTGTNCQSVKKYYYDCAYCDQIGTTTWNSTTYGPHDYDTVWSNDKSGHWHECSLCHDKKDEAAHTPGAAATETTPQKCTECDYIITPALGHIHSLTPVAAKDATCTNDGNTAYYVCSGCSKWYEDAAGITVNIAERTLIRTTARLKR